MHSPLPRGLGAVAESYLLHLACTCTTATVKGARSDLGKVERWCKARGLENIDALNVHIARQYAAQRLHEVKPPTVNAEIRRLKALTRWCVAEGLLDVDPLASLRQARVSQPDTPRYLTLGQVARMLPFLTPPYRLLAWTAAKTGLRKGELYRLEWTDVDLERQLVHVRAEGNKTHRGRFVPLDDELTSLLTTSRNGSAWVFPTNRGTRRSVNNPRPNEALKKAAGLAGLPEPIPSAVSLHWLRHSYASALRMAGCDLEVVGRLLGHSNRDTTRIYEHLTPDFLRSEATRLPNLENPLALMNCDRMELDTFTTEVNLLAMTKERNLVAVDLPPEWVDRADDLADLVATNRTRLVRAAAILGLRTLRAIRSKDKRQDAVIDALRKADQKK